MEKKHQDIDYWLWETLGGQGSLNKFKTFCWKISSTERFRQHVPTRASCHVIILWIFIAYLHYIFAIYRKYLFSISILWFPVCAFYYTRTLIQMYRFCLTLESTDLEIYEDATQKKYKYPGQWFLKSILTWHVIVAVL